MKWLAAGVLIFVAGAAADNLAASRYSIVKAAPSTSANAPTPVPTAVSTTGAPQFDSETNCITAVPRAWGEYKGGSSQSGLAFEAPDGTLRFLTNLPCGSQPVVALKIIRTDKGK
ncbi:MAG: hypothetical protein WA823_06215 [Candidatus Acidiferrales bacterium]